MDRPRTNRHARARRQKLESGELVTGSVRVELTPNAETATAHVSFCPPFAAAPEITIEEFAPAEASISPSQILPNGERFDLKLLGSSEATRHDCLVFFGDRLSFEFFA